MLYEKTKNTVKIGVVILIIINILFLSSSMIGRVIGDYVEYYYNPVMIPGSYISGRESSNGYSIISYNALKIRDCDWISTEWFFGNPDDKTNRLQVPMYHGETPEIRETGEHLWEDTYVNLTIDEIINNSYGIATHSCNPFWYTKSLLFVGTNNETNK